MYPKYQSYRGWGGVYRGRGLQRHGMGGLNVGRHGHGFWGSLANEGNKLIKKSGAKLLDVGKKRALDLGKQALDVGKKKAKQALDLGKQKAKQLFDVGKQKAKEASQQMIKKAVTQTLEGVLGTKQGIKKKELKTRKPAAKLIDEPVAKPTVNIPQTVTPPVCRKRKYRKVDGRRIRIGRRTRSRRHIFM